MNMDKKILESINNILVELEASPNLEVIEFAKSFPELEKCIDYLQKKLYS